VFWINLPVGVITTLLVVRNLKQPSIRRTGGRIDGIGTALLAGGIGAAMATLIQWDTLSFPVIAGLWGVALVCLAAFAVRERGSAEPMLALYLLRRPVILAAITSTLLCGALVLETSAFIPAWVQGVPGRSTLAAGFAVGVLTVAWTATSMGLGPVLRRLSSRTVAFLAALGLVLGSAGLLGLAQGGWALLLVACLPLGAGLGANSLVFTVAVQEAVGQTDRGRATSLYYFARLIGQAVGAAAFGGVLNARLAAGGPATIGALRELMDPVSRGALPAAELARLVPALDGALFGVFAFGLVVALLTVPASLLVPRKSSP
jgi:MFS family permease